MNTVTLYRPVNQHELYLIEVADWRSFPPRLPEQPIFYPVLDVDYAIQITREWNVPAFGEGHVVRFEIDKSYFETFEVQTVGLDHFQEIWVPSEDLGIFNNHLVGPITLIHSFKN
jgi:hypothetical protein